MRDRNGVTSAAPTSPGLQGSWRHHRDEVDLAAARAGDQDAWAQLYRGVHRRLRAYIVCRVGAEHVEDVMAETMRRAVAGLDGFTRGPSGFDGWVFGIARRVVFEHSRGVTTAQPGDASASAEEHEFVRRLFTRLSPADQELLELRTVAGLTADEVAVVLGKRPGVVRAAQARALAKLRRLMEAADRRSDDV